PSPRTEPESGDRTSWSAQAQVVVPQQSRRDGTPRPPALADPVELLRGGPASKLFDFLHRAGQYQIGGGPDIGPEQRHQQIDVGAPTTDPVESDQRRACGVVVEAREVTEVEAFARDRFGESADVANLLSSQPGASQRGFVDIEHSVRRDSTHGRGKARIRRAGRGERDLLLEDDADHRGEAGPAGPEWWRSEASHDRRKIWIDAGEVRQTGEEPVAGQPVQLRRSRRRATGNAHGLADLNSHLRQIRQRLLDFVGRVLVVLELTLQIPLVGAEVEESVA